jgi:hypothetical protein
VCPASGNVVELQRFEEGSQLLHPGRERLQLHSHSQWITVLQLTTPYTCAKPPSTNNSAPVTKLASSEARNTTALAISSGVPSLPSGTLLEMFFNRCWPVSEEPRSPLSPGVSIEPGLTAFTRMRRSFKSVVHVRAIAPVHVADSRCTGNGCTLAVPLGSVNWQFTGDAINTLITQQAIIGVQRLTFPLWIMKAWPSSQGPFQPSNFSPTPATAFPTWSKVNNPL